MTDELFRRLAGFVSRIRELETDIRQGVYEDVLTPLQHQSLEVLYFSGPRNLTSLSHCLGINLSNGSREVRKLDRLGLVKKSISGMDRRVVEVELSDSGRGTVEQVLARMRSTASTRLASLTPEDQKAILAAMEVLDRKLIGRYFSES